MLHRCLSQKKIDTIVARDTTNGRYWLIVESLKEGDEFSTKFLSELDGILFKDLHLTASHRLQEQSHARFREKARFFAMYSGDDGDAGLYFQLLHYIMLVHLYDSHILPSSTGTWKKQAQELAHLLRGRQ
ncbi:hypothetical protein BGZ67_003796 [Mortierella alpina]|nr:hypothetical protein BGZ67_003796 [Mortierella alpina]